MQSFLAFQRVGAPDLISPTRGTSVRPCSDDAVTMQWRPGCAVVLCKLNSLNAPQQLPAWFLTATIFPRKKVVFITFSLVSWPCDFLKNIWNDKLTAIASTFLTSDFTPGKSDWSGFFLGWFGEFDHKGDPALPSPTSLVTLPHRSQHRCTPQCTDSFNVMWILCRKLCGAFCGSNFLCGCSVVWLFALSISSWQASTQSLVMLIQKACFFPLSLTFGDTNLRHHHHQERRLWKHTTPPLSPSSSILILLSSPSSADSGGTQEYILQIMASQHCIWKSNVSDFIFGAIFSSSHSSVLLPWTHVTIETEKKKEKICFKVWSEL